MAEVFRYEVIPSSSWAYLSTILMVSIYFKFNRLISVRNLDILMLVLLAPGLLIVQHGQQERQKLEPQIRGLVREIRTLEELEEQQTEKSNISQTYQVEQASSRKIEFDPENRSKANGTGEKSSGNSEDTGGESAGPEDSQKAEQGENSSNADVEETLLTPAQQLQKQLTEQTDELNRIKRFQYSGFVWLFSAGAALLIRMLIDPFMIRRPLLEPNLEFSGLTFLAVVLLIFLIANIIMATSSPDDITAVESGKNLATAKATDPTSSKGPGYSLLFLLPAIPTFVAEENGPKTGAVSDSEGDTVGLTPELGSTDSEDTGTSTSAEPSSDSTPERETDGSGESSAKDNLADTDQPRTADHDSVGKEEGALIVVAKIMAIIGQLSIVIGIYLIGYLHFGNTRMGIGIVTLYLLLPYTAEMTGRIIHILPAAAMVWAVVCYRKPFWSGTFIGLAMGLTYYPVFLLPLWFSFYWHRGLKQFVIGFLVMVAILAVTLVFTSSDLNHFWQNLRAMFGIWTPLMEGLTGFWEEGSLDASYRIPIIAAFFCLSISFVAWPAQKDLGTLLSCSAALMLAVQFWNGFGGGLLMAWYLPLALMTIFRPNLEDRTAIALTLDR